jgi:hypothetical protein
LALIGEKMANRMFIDKSNKPDKQSLSKALGATYKYWEEIRESLDNEYEGLVEEWKYYGQKSGWTLKLLYKKRNLFFFAPYDTYFIIAFVFGDKAVAAIEKSDLPKAMIEELVNAKKYVEGRGLRIEVKTRNDIEHIKKLVEIKINN